MERRMSLNLNEITRLKILTDVRERHLKQSRGAKILGISTRQFRRLLQRFRTEGPGGIVSRKAGRPSNRRISKNDQSKILSFFELEDHSDFSPTLAHEYLVDNGMAQFSISTVRRVMVENGLWHVSKVREKRVHPLRQRRSKMGELIQIDGSEHDWFEGRGSRCTLLVFIDDATSNTLHLKFVKSENTFDYFEATREYIEQHGRPEAFYSDKHSVFRVNREDSIRGGGRTQFGRAMDELDIDLICANSPQAKGRVERRNRDFQNRLIKAMRVAKICDIEAANVFIPSFLSKFNQKFAKAPLDPQNAHRPLLPTQNLDRIFCLKANRWLSKNLTLQYDNVIYQVLAPGIEYTLRKAKVIVLEIKNGDVSIEYRGKPLTAVPHHKMQARAMEVSSKELLATLMERKKCKYRPGRHHPWKRGSRGFSSKEAPLALYC